jgi:uncharacterized protein (TIGR01777 family)
MRVVIAGGSGFLGGALTDRLLHDGHQVVVLSRGSKEVRDAPGLRTVSWSPNGEVGAWATELDGAGAIVNLAGAGMADKRWSSARKQLLRDSRLQSTRSLAAAVRRAVSKPDVFIQASAVGYYGAYESGDEFDESSPPGSDFLARTAVDWEGEAHPVAALGCRLVFSRTGVVLSRHGGVLARMLPPFQFFVGGPIGSGRQYMSWIHLDDWVGIITWAITNADVTGPVNVTSPHPVTNAEFSRALGRALHRPSLMPVPGFALKVMFGEMAGVMLLRGQFVRPRRATELGYKFRYDRIDEAMKHAV